VPRPHSLVIALRPPCATFAALRASFLAIPLACFVALFSRAAAGEVVFKLTDAKGAPVADAVVSLVPLDAPAKLTPPETPVEIAQLDKEFQSLVTPLVVGSTVNFPNNDRDVAHQVYSQSEVKKFALPLYKPGRSGNVVFDRPGVVVVGCNIHAWMLAYVVVLETPWFAKSGADGTATITRAPPGRYRAEVWHPTLKKNETREITVTDGASPALAFSLAAKPIPRIRRTPGASGGGYK